jgi:hypothetical protein
MKQSTTLNLIFINVLAASILAVSCADNSENQQCVDEEGKVVNDNNCNQNNPHYRWYYGGGLFNHGSHVSGGRYVPLVGHSYTTPSQRSTGSSFWGGSSHGTSTPSVSRGGFGSSGHGFSSGS